MKKRILLNMKSGDLRSIGKSDEAVELVLANPQMFGELVASLLDGDRLMRARSADAVEKATRVHPEWLQPWKRYILDEVAAHEEKQLRWHVAQLLPRLKLSATERERAVDILREYLRDKSSIVRTFSMQALADLADDDPASSGQVRSLIARLMRSGTPAMKARGRKLMHKFDKKRQYT